MKYQKKNNSSTQSFTDFKKSIFSKIVAYVNPHYQYIEKTHIGLPELLHSDLFEEKNYTISGGDQIVGHHNGVAFQSCNLTVTYRKNFSNEKDPDDYVFGGNFFVARFPKKFSGSIAIHSKKGFFGSMKDNDIASYLNTSGEKIRLEDPEFQKQFEVYGNDQINARRVLTPTFMERVKEISQRNKGEVYITVNENNIVIATNKENSTTVGNNVNGMLFTKIDMKLIQNMYKELTEQLTMIDTLKLNNEIWRN